MTIEVTCDCSMNYRLPDRFAGKTCRCRECGESIRVPAESALKTERSKKAEKKPAKAKPKKARAARPASDRVFTSESIHQMSPLNLSESRVSEPRIARAKLKKAQTVGIIEKKRKRATDEKPLKKVRRGSDRDEESEEELPRSKKNRRDEPDERPKKKGKARRDDRDDDDDAFEAERPKKGKAAKAEKKARKGKGRDLRDSRVEDEDDADEAETTGKKLTPRQAKRRQQLLLLGGSLGLALVVGLLFVGVVALSKRSEEHAVQALADAKKKVADAQNAAKAQDWDKAKTLYADAIKFVEDPSNHIEDAEFLGTFKLLKAENDGYLGKIVAARAKLATDPAGAAKDFELFTGAQDDEVIFLAGVEGLVAANDGAYVDLLATCAKTAKFPSVKNAAVKGLIQAGVPSATPFLAGVIRSEGGKSDLGRAAVQKSLEGLNPDADALIAVIQTKDVDAGSRGRALKLLGAFRDKKYEPIIEQAKNDPETAKDAADALAELRGEKL